MKQAINQLRTLKNNSGNTILSYSLRLCLSLCLFLCLSLPSFAKSPALVQRLEPASWWVGMQQTELQLMVYGSGIATADITIQYPGVTQLRKQHTDIQNKALFYLNISA
jgi:hypothetical protein